MTGKPLGLSGVEAAGCGWRGDELGKEPGDQGDDCAGKGLGDKILLTLGLKDHLRFQIRFIFPINTGELSFLVLM